MALPEKYKVEFTPTEKMHFYHVPGHDYGYKMVPTGKNNQTKKVELNTSGMVDCRFAAHVCTTFPDNFKLIKGKLEDAIAEAQEAEVVAMDKAIPGAAYAINELRNQIGEMAVTMENIQTDNARLKADNEALLEKVGTLEKAKK